ncbi:Mucin-5B [Merluccius polli]|uniref:Mucin-5B n=1 Tax=Merluccius polli TaxID=89951 RepID=A0AA47PBP1_MERPO|nr:Mucin-5B [Merluccius polli]
MTWGGDDAVAGETCPLTMEYHECGSPCADTCSNPDTNQTCDSRCTDGCFCPAGMVVDDVTHQGCVPLKSCPCSYNGKTFMPGESYTSNCKTWYALLFPRLPAC